MSDENLSAIVGPMNKVMDELEIAMTHYYGTRKKETHKSVTQNYLDRAYAIPNQHSEKDIANILDITTKSVCEYLRLDIPRVFLGETKTDKKIGELGEILEQLNNEQDQWVIVAHKLAGRLTQVADSLCDIYDEKRLLRNQ